LGCGWPEAGRDQWLATTRANFFVAAALGMVTTTVSAAVPFSATV